MSTSPKTDDTMRRGASLATVGAAALLLLAACEGENLFTGESPALEPRVVEVAAPAAVYAGDTVGVRITATAARDVAQILFSVRGAVARDTVVKLLTPAPQVSEVVRVPVPATLGDSLLVVQVAAVDALGAVSRPLGDTLTAVAVPEVVSVTAPASVGLGGTATFGIVARGSRPLAAVTVTASGAVSGTTTLPVVPAAREVTQSLALQLPATFADTVVQVEVKATDVNGRQSAPVSAVVPVVVPAPTLQLGAPASALPGTRVDLSLLATGARGVRALKLELRGAITQDTVIVVDPAAGTVDRSVSLVVPGSATASELRVRAWAEDAAGVLSAVRSATIAVTQGPPTIVSLSAPASTRPGQMVDVRVVAAGIRPLTEIRVGFRGAANQDLTVPVAPPRPGPVTADVAILVPEEATDTLLTIRATAVDQAGELSEIHVTSLPVILPPPDTTDTTTVAMAPAAAPSAAPVPWILLAGTPAPGGSSPPAAALPPRGWRAAARPRRRRR